MLRVRECVGDTRIIDGIYRRTVVVTFVPIQLCKLLRYQFLAHARARVLQKNALTVKYYLYHPPARSNNVDRTNRTARTMRFYATSRPRRTNYYSLCEKKNTLGRDTMNFRSSFVDQIFFCVCSANLVMVWKDNNNIIKTIWMHYD